MKVIKHMVHKKITKTPTMLGMEDRIPLGNYKGKKVKELVKQKDLVKKKGVIIGLIDRYRYIFEFDDEVLRESNIIKRIELITN